MMEVEIFNWEDFKMEKLHEQIQTGSVGIGFRAGGLTVSVYGKSGGDKDRPDWWTVYAVFEEDGKPKRTMSRKLAPKDVTLELERSVKTAQQMVSTRRAS